MLVCVNDALTDVKLRCVLLRLDTDKDKEVFGLVCKRWLHLQSTDRKKLAARAGPHMLRRLAARFTQIVELDLSQSVSRYFYLGVTDSDLAVISEGFECLIVLNLHTCKVQVLDFISGVDVICLLQWFFPFVGVYGVFLLCALQFIRFKVFLVWERKYNLE